MSDAVNKPSHYTDGKIEVIDFIEDKKLGFNLGNAIKYISRAGKKDPEKEIEDLEKAQWYLNRQINNLIQAKFRNSKNPDVNPNISRCCGADIIWIPNTDSAINQSAIRVCCNCNAPIIDLKAAFAGCTSSWEKNFIGTIKQE